MTVTAAQKRAFLKALDTDGEFREQVRALLRPAPTVRKPGVVGVRFIDEHGIDDPAADEQRRRARAAERDREAAERDREAALPPPPSLRRSASDAIDLTGGRFGSAS